MPIVYCRGLGDQAPLLVGFAGAFRRSEIVAIDIDRLARLDESVMVTIPYSKAHQDVRGRMTVPAEPASGDCPVRALKN